MTFALPHRRQSLSLLLVLMLLAGPAFAATADTFAEGNAAYAKGDFKAALNLYSQALTTQQTANIWYNFGNANFRLGDLGHAAVAYERALVLLPWHSQAAANLQFIRKKTTARAPDPTALGIVLGAIPPAASLWVAVGLAWLGFAWAGTALWRRSGLGGVVGGLFLVALSASYAAGVIWWHRELSLTGVVVASSVQARHDPFEPGKNAETLPAGTALKRKSEAPVNGAHLYELPGGSLRWISSGGIDMIVGPNP